MDWQTLELLKFVALAILAIGLHLFIRWFGKNYATDIFGATPEVGKHFLILADVAYYLIFAAYVLFNVHFVRPERWGSDQASASQLQDSVGSIAGICLIIGILHGINVFVLPFIGSILALRKKLMEPRAP